MIVKEEWKLTKFGVEEGPPRQRHRENTGEWDTTDEWRALEEVVSGP